MKQKQVLGVIFRFNLIKCIQESKDTSNEVEIIEETLTEVITMAYEASCTMKIKRVSHNVAHGTIDI